MAAQIAAAKTNDQGLRIGSGKGSAATTALAVARGRGHISQRLDFTNTRSGAILAGRSENDIGDNKIGQN